MNYKPLNILTVEALRQKTWKADMFSETTNKVGRSVSLLQLQDQVIALEKKVEDLSARLDEITATQTEMTERLMQTDKQYCILSDQIMQRLMDLESPGTGASVSTRHLEIQKETTELEDDKDIIDDPNQFVEIISKMDNVLLSEEKDSQEVVYSGELKINGKSVPLEIRGNIPDAIDNFLYKNK